jgi:hypothetical protein
VSAASISCMFAALIWERMRARRSAALPRGRALAGPLAGRSVTACLLTAAAIELCAAATYLLTSVKANDTLGVVAR